MNLGRISYRIRRSLALDVVKFLALIAGLIWLTVRGAEQLGYNWQWYRVSRFIFAFNEDGFSAGPLLDGVMVTLRITGASLGLSLVFGLLAALLQLSGSIVARILARGYVEIIRNTPLLIQLFFIYFVLSPVIGLERFWAAVLTLSLFEGAYAAEIIRSGIVNIQRGQWEAAHSLGLSTFHTYGWVILPQALRRVLPPLTSQAVSLIKDSALVSTIAIYDLTMQAQAIVSETFLTFEIWLTVAAMYLVMTITLSTLVGIMEKRMEVK